MELYIEKAFIDDFYLEVNLRDIHVSTTAQKSIISIFRDYGEVTKFINAPFETPEELDSLKKSNELIAYLFEIKGPLPILSVKDHFFMNSKCEQTLIFTQKTESWFEEAIKKGALCFSLETYEEGITSIIKNVEKLNIDVDEFEGWHLFDCLCDIPFNKLLICDNYILTDKSQQKIEDNLLPMLKSVLKQGGSHIPITILSKDFNPPRPGTAEQINQSLQRKITFLNNRLSAYSLNFRVFTTEFSAQNIDIHGRELLTNFLMVKAGKGFNLLPRPNSSNEAPNA